MKGFLCALIAVCLVATGINFPVLASCDNAEIIYNFEDYVAERASESTPPTKWTCSIGGDSSEAYVYSAETQRGRSLVTEVHDISGQLELKAERFTFHRDDITKPLAFEVSIYRKDKSSEFIFGGRVENSGGEVKPIANLKKDGTISVLYNNIPDFTYEVDKWIDIKLVIIPNENRFAVFISQGDKFTEYFGTQNLSWFTAEDKGFTNLQLYYNAGEYDNAGMGSITMFDDIRIYSCDSFELPTRTFSNEDALITTFNGWSPTATKLGLTGLNGFATTGAQENKSGYDVVNLGVGDDALRIFSTDDTSVGAEYKMNSFSERWTEENTISGQIRIPNDNFSDIKVYARRKDYCWTTDILKFNGGNVYVNGSSEPAATYETNKWYKFTVYMNDTDEDSVLDDFSVSLEDDTTTLIDKQQLGKSYFNGFVGEIDDQYTRVGFSIDKVSGTSSMAEQAYLDLNNLKVAAKMDDSVEAAKDFSFLFSSPTTQRVMVSPNEKVKVLFNKGINSDMSGVWTLNDEPIAENHITLSDEQQGLVFVDLSGLCQLNTEYTLKYTNLKDNFNKSISGSLIFKTVPKNYLIVPKVSGNDGIYDIGYTGASLDGNSYNAVAIAVAYDNSGNGAKMVNPQKTSSVLETALIADDISGYTISDNTYDGIVYFWDSLTDMNVIATEKILQNCQTDIKGYSGNISIKTVPDYVNGTITVMGQADGEYVTIEVLKPGRTSSELSGANPLDAVLYLKQAKCKDGGFKETFLVGENHGPMILRLNYQNDEGVKEFSNKIDYLNDAGRIGLVADFNEPTNNFDTLIQSAFVTIGLDDRLYNGLTPENKIKVQDAMKVGGFSSVSDVQSRYNQNAYLHTLLQTEDFETTINTYVDIWNIKDLSSYDTFMEYKAYIKDDVFNVMEDDTFETLEQFEKKLNDNVILHSIGKTSLYSQTQAIISNNIEYLGWDLTEYNKVNDKSTVFAALSGNKYISIESRGDGTTSLHEAFDAAVKDSLTKQGIYNQSNGSDISISFSIHDKTPTDKSEISDDLIESEDKFSKEIYTDIESVPWAKEAIYALSDLNVLNGVGNRKFAPIAQVKREEFVKIIVGAFAENAPDASVDFSDVGKNEWYNSYIRKAYNAGIVNGYNGQFGVGFGITRQDMAVMCLRAARYAGINLESKETLDFVDSHAISDYAIEAVSVLSASGIITGDDNSKFNPLDNATRAEAAKVVYMLMQRRM